MRKTTFVLWGVMVAMLLASVAEFLGPWQGWFEPTVDRIFLVVGRDAVTPRPASPAPVISDTVVVAPVATPPAADTPIMAPVVAPRTDTAPVQPVILPPPEFAYDTSREKTPLELAKSMEQYAQWLQAQTGRTGGQIATAIWAKKSQGRVVLYVAVHDNFMSQKRPLRELAVEMMWRMWGRRLVQDRKVFSSAQAHLVLVDKDGTVVGGSKPEKASDLWVRP